MSSSESQPIKPAGKKAIGATAARLRKQFEAFEAARRRTQEKLRKEREDLARDLAEAEKREQRKQRNCELNDQKKIKFVLGGLALDALRRQGRRAFALTATDLDGLSPKDREMLDQVLLVKANKTGPPTDEAASVDIRID